MVEAKVAFKLNVFHILADISHIVSKFILIWAIHSNKSAEGVSLITQALYALVFCTRYLDLFSTDFIGFLSKWNFVLKIFYITSSFYIIYVMMRVYARTREREKGWKLGAYTLFGSLILTMPTTKILSRYDFTVRENFWVFSEILESTAVLPQLLLLRQTTVPTVIDSYYLLCLGAYRGLYILNWIVRGIEGDKPNAISVIFGVIQTALYIDFGWVYYTRQRVKLRGGAVVDADDFRHSWLINRLVGRKGPEPDEFDEEDAPGFSGDGHGPNNANGNARSKVNKPSRWGRRGISVSADDEVHDIHADTDEDARPLADPESFEDESEGEDAPINKVGNGREWRDEDRD